MSDDEKAKVTPFTFVNVLISRKEPLHQDPEMMALFPKFRFMILRALSLHVDTVMAAQEMNLRSYLGAREQFAFLLNTTRAGRRPYRKWPKLEPDTRVDLLIRYYGVSSRLAHSLVDLHSVDQLSAIEAYLTDGGLTTRPRKTDHDDTSPSTGSPPRPVC